MGVDCEILFSTGRELSEQDEKILAWRLVEAVGRRFFYPERPFHRLHSSSEMYGTTATHEINSLERFYGEGYERGHWPDIAAVITWLRLNFPNGQVWYGGDTGEALTLITDQFMSETWKHWAEHGGVPYRDNGRGPNCCGAGIFINAWHGNRRGGYCPVCAKNYWITPGNGLEPRDSN